MLECDYNDHIQKDQCKNYPKHENTRNTSEIINLRIQCIFGPQPFHIFQIFMMALRQKIEWDTEEVAAGYDLSSIYEEVDDNSTAPVISSVVNTTDHSTVSPALNITAGLSELVKEVVKQAVEMVANTTNTTTIPINTVPTIMAPPSSSTPFTISTVVKKVVEHLGREPILPEATVCIIFFK